MALPSLSEDSHIAHGAGVTLSQQGLVVVLVRKVIVMVMRREGHLARVAIRLMDIIAVSS